MVANEEVAQFIILKFPQIPISILCHCNDDTDKVVCTCTYRYIYIFTYLYYLDFFKFRYTNVMALVNRFYSTVLIFFINQHPLIIHALKMGVSDNNKLYHNISMCMIYVK